MLAGEVLLRAAAALVGPDDFVEEELLTKDLVADQPAVGGGMPVQVEGQHARAAEQLVGVLDQPAQEGQVGVLGAVAIRIGGEFRRGTAGFPAGLAKTTAAGEAVAGHEGRVDVHALGLGGIIRQHAAERRAAIAAQEQIAPLADDLPGNINRFKHGETS